MRKDTYYIWALLLVVVCGIAALFLFGNTEHDLQGETEVATTTNEVEVPETGVTPPVLPWGEVTLKVGEKAVFTDVSIKPVSIEEESRCPSDVQCIQAGTVRVKLETVSGMGTSTDTLTLGEFITTEAQKITFTKAAPYPVAGAHIPTSAYALTFTVEKRVDTEPEVTPVVLPVPPPDSTTACYVGGCSSQLCTDSRDMVSTCEYREEYACYQTATCERQVSGQCGWTSTAELRSCVAKES